MMMMMMIMMIMMMMKIWISITENLVKSVPLKCSPTEKDILDGFLECESKTDNSIDNSTDNAKFNSKAPKENSIYINFIQDMKQQFQIQFTDTHSKKTYFKFYFQLSNIEPERANEDFQRELIELRSNEFYKSKIGATVTSAVTVKNHKKY